MNQEGNGRAATGMTPGGGLAGWLLGRLRVSRRPIPRLALVERIALAPRHSLALVEAEGRWFLVATSAEGAPVFYPLDEGAPAGRFNGAVRTGRAVRAGALSAARVSW